MSLSAMPSVLATSSRPGCGRLGRRPDLELAVLEVRRAVLRLERRVRDERIGVRAPRRPSPRRRARRRRRRRCAACAPAAASTARPRVARSPSLLCDAVAPSSHVTLQLLARRLRRPPGVGDDRDAAEQPGRARVAAPSTTKACCTPGSALISSRFALSDLAAEHRALLEDRVSMPGTLDVDAEERLAGDDLRVVDAARSACR